MTVGFDIISDLNLTKDDFVWDGKPTSLFCLVPGNISSDMTIVMNTLKHLSKCYQGVFFIDGYLENNDVNMRDPKIKEFQRLCSGFNNVIYLHANVVIVDGIGLVGINGWDERHVIWSDTDKFQAKCNKYEDVIYLEKTIERLQLHVDVKKIIVISNTVPTKELYFKETQGLSDDLYAGNVINADTENKIVTWVFGSTNKIIDTIQDGINYVNNPKFDREPYYPKRIEIDI